MGSVSEELSERRGRLRRLHKPLSFVFWGGLLVVLDLNLTFGFIGGGHVHFDLLHDTLGFALVATGLLRITARRAWRDGWEVVIGFVTGAAVAAFVGDLVSWWFPWRDLVPFGVAVFLWLVFIVAVILFALALAWLARDLHLPTVERAWHRTAILAAACYGGTMVQILLTKSFTGQLALQTRSVVLLVAYWVVLAAPLVSLFLAARHMMRATESTHGSARAAGGAI